MEHLAEWFAANSLLVWIAAGLLLLTGEMLVPGIYLLWLGLAALATALVHALLPGLDILGQIATFAGFSAISIYGGYRVFYKERTEIDQATAPVNRRGAQHVGRVYSVVSDIIGGRGKVRVGDTQWLATGPDCPAGTPVRVTAVEGTVLVVAPLDEEAVVAQDG